MNKSKCVSVLFAVASLFLFRSEAAFTSAIDPKSGNFFVLEDGAIYLSVNYYAWGPGWSGVGRKASATEVGDLANFTSENTMNNDVTFLINGTLSHPQANQLLFDATLTPGGTSEMIQAQFGLAVGEAFSGSEATVTLADGTTSQTTLPFGRGTVGETVVKMVLQDAAGRKTELIFSEPESITMDRGDARMAIAHEQITEGKLEKLNITITLPEETTFVPGPIAGAKISDLSDWYTFAPQSPVPENSEWSLSSWVEAPAGKHGRITRDGEKLMYNDSPFKLWGLNVCFGSCAPEKELADKRADFYAAMGINAVRLHKYADGTGWAGILSKESATQYDSAKLDLMDYFIAAMKKRGVYTKLSPVFIIDIGPGDREKVPFMDEFGPMRGNRIDPKHGSLFLSTELQDLLTEQMVNLLEHTNPYTGLTYAKDPTIAYIEIYNEDCTLWGGITGTMSVSPTLRARGGKMFATWLKEKYETEEAFLAAWGDKAVNNEMLKNLKLPMDESWAEDRIYPAGNPWFFDPTNLYASQLPVKRRLFDTMAFLYELQNDVYDRYITTIRKTGYQGEIITSNWQAGRMMSHFYNLYSDSQTGTIDRHNYFGSGQRGSMAINSGSMLASAGSGSLSSGLQQVDGNAFMLSEWIHVLPNEWGVEGPALIGAYGMGLQGWDVSFAFQSSDEGTFSHSIGLHDWDATVPQFIGVFPAVSRQVHRGDVQESTVVHRRNVCVASLDEGKVGFDEKVIQRWDEKTFTSDVFPAEAIAVAKGVVHFTDQFEPTETFDLSAYRQDDALVSSTKQLRWVEGTHSRDGHIEINTVGTQAIVGFAEGQEAIFDDATITQRSRYSAIYLSAQSKEGVLATDAGILITALARSRNHDMIVIEDSLLISRGKAKYYKPLGPVVMEPVIADIVLKRDGTPTVHILDHTGVKTGRTVPVIDGRFTIDTGRDATPYYLISYSK